MAETRARPERNGRLAQLSRELPARIDIKANSWLDGFTRRSSLDGVGKHEQLHRLLSEVLNLNPAHARSMGTFEGFIDARLEILHGSRPPFDCAHNGSRTLGALCHSICASLKPRIVVETGVAYGITSAYVLQALHTNSFGELESVDLPPLAGSDGTFIGFLVPEYLRQRWRLHRGSSRILLPRVFGASGPVDLFIHDSLHTYSHMKWEFRIALDALRPGGIIIADDIEGNRAFEETIRHPSVDAWFAVEQEGKSAVCGVMRKRLA